MQCLGILLCHNIFHEQTECFLLVGDCQLNPCVSVRMPSRMILRNTLNAIKKKTSELELLPLTLLVRELTNF